MLCCSLWSVSVRPQAVSSQCAGTAEERRLWRHGARLLGSVFLWVLLCSCLAVAPQVRTAHAWSSGSVVGGTFQDGERNYRQGSVAQSLQGGERRGILLPDDAHNPRKNKVRTALADNAVALAEPGGTAALAPEDWRVKIISGSRLGKCRRSAGSRWPRNLCGPRRRKRENPCRSAAPGCRWPCGRCWARM